MRHQQSRFNHYFDRQDVGYYTNKAEDDGLQMVPTTAIKGRDYARGVALRDPEDGTIYMSGAGRDIWWWHDDFNYMHDTVSGDHTFIVNVEKVIMPYFHEWSKAGIFLRSSLETNAAYYGVFLSGSQGVCPQGRLSDGAHPGGWTCVNVGATSAWLKIEQRMGRVESFVGSQETEGGPVTWTSINVRTDVAIDWESYEAGLGVSSVHWTSNEVTFKDYEVDSYNFPSAAPTLTSAPTNDAGRAAWEIWEDIGESTLNYLTSNPRYPDSPDRIEMLLEGTEIPVNTMGRYGSRLWTYVTAPVTGTYTFWIASDDQGELWLSPSTVKSQALRIAYVDGWTSYRQWDKFPSTQKSGPIELVAGDTYYLEALHKEGGGGDNLSIAWAIPGQGGAPVIIAPQYINLDAPSDIPPLARKLRGQK